MLYSRAMLGWLGVGVLAACASAGSPRGRDSSGGAADGGSAVDGAADGGEPNRGDSGDAALEDAGAIPLAFVDVAASLGLPPLGAQCLAFEDFDGDAKPDILMVSQDQLGNENLSVYQNTGSGFFHVVTTGLKLGTGDNMHCAVGDVDNDGLPDVVATTQYQSAMYVLHNKGSAIFAQTATLEFPGSSVGAGPVGFADFNGDGWLDLIAGSFRIPPAPSQAPCAPTSEGFACVVSKPRCGPPPVIFPNTGTGAFGSPVSVVDPSTCGPADVNALAITDYNGDGRPDVFVANDWGVDAFYIQGTTPLTFTDIAPTVGLKGYNHAMGAAFADYDLDGKLDVYVSDLGSSQFYLGQGGGALMAHGTDWGVAIATTYTSNWSSLADDLDSDGFTDLWTANSGEVHDYSDLTAIALGGTQLPPGENSDFVFQNQGGHGFQLLIVPQTLQAAPQAVNGAVATADYDGDGRLDIAELVGYPTRMQLMHNEGSQAHWFEARLTGHQSNRDGIGALVTLVQAGRPNVSRLVERTRGSVGESWSVVHFGLGNDPDIAELDIQWPSGTKQTLMAPASDQLLTVEEPAE